MAAQLPRRERLPFPSSENLLDQLQKKSLHLFTRSATEVIVVFQALRSGYVARVPMAAACCSRTCDRSKFVSLSRRNRISISKKFDQFPYIPDFSRVEFKVTSIKSPVTSITSIGKDLRNNSNVFSCITASASGVVRQTILNVSNVSIP